MKLLTLLWAVIIALSIIAFILVLKNKKYAKIFSGLTVVISVLSLIISSISGQIQQDQTHAYIQAQHNEDREYFDLALQEHVTKEFVDKTFEEKLDQRVDVIFKDDIFLVELQMKREHDSTWKKVLDLNPGDRIEFQLHFRNNGSGIAEDVMMRVSLPEGLTYIDNSAVLFNASNPEGVYYNDPTSTVAVNVGDYAAYGDAYLRFGVKVQDNSFEKGLTYRYITWAKVSAKGEALQDHTQVYVKMNNDS